MIIGGIVMRLKDNVVIEYCTETESTIISQGILQYVIEDKNKYYFDIFNKDYYQKDKLPKEQYEFLINNKLVTKDTNYSDLDKRFHRNMYFYECFTDNCELNVEEIHKSIRNKDVVIIGVGGVGTVILDSLQRMGFHNFTIIDYDFVEKSNLNRQLLFKEKHIGEYKVEAVSKELLTGCNVTKHQKKISSVKDMEDLSIYKADFIINCADTPNDIGNIVHQFAKSYDIPSISGGVGIDSGQWGPIYDESHKFQDGISNNIKIKGSNASTNAIISNFMAFEVMLYLSNLYLDYPFYKEKNLNFKTLQMDVY